MEYWSTEVLGIKADDGLILFSEQCPSYKKDLIPPNPLLQYSIIPIRHGIQFRQSLLSMTRSQGPGFQR
jgi:hypothetical protein